VAPHTPAAAAAAPTAARLRALPPPRVVRDVQRLRLRRTLEARRWDQAWLGTVSQLHQHSALRGAYERSRAAPGAHGSGTRCAFPSQVH